MENSAECWNEIQVPNLEGNFSEYKAENGSEIEQAEISKAGCISAGHCVNRETLDEVKDDSVEKSERTVSSERGRKLNASKLSGWLSTDFASPSPKVENVSECFEEDEIKALSQPIAMNKAASSALDESAVFTSPERNLMLMEQLSENGKTCAADSVTHHNDEAVESHAIIFTTPEQVLLLGDSGLDEAGKEEDHTATDFPAESDVLNTTEKCFVLGGSRKTEARNEGESIVVELHDESDIATSSERQSSVGDFKGDGIERNEENRTVEFPCDSGTCTSPDRHILLGNLVSDGSEDSGGWQGINRVDKSGFLTSLERQLLYGETEQKEAVKTEEKAAAEFHDESAVPNIPERHPFPEDSELKEAALSEENKAVELRVDCGIFASAEKHLLFETDEEMKKGDTITATSHVVSDVVTAAEGQSIMGDSEPDEAEKQYRENKDMELLSESNISTNLERHLLSGDSGLDGTSKIKDNTAATCEESFVFTSPERRLLLGNSEPHNAGKQERKEVEFKDDSAFFTRLESRLLLGESGQDRLDVGKSDLSHHASSSKVILKENSVVRGSHVAALDFIENTNIDSNGRIASKVSYSHEFNAGQESAGTELMPKGSQAENVVGLDAIQGTKQSRRDSVDLFDDFDIQEGETIIEAERNVSLGSYVLALPAKDNSCEELTNEDNSETIGEISSHLEVAGTCSMVSGEQLFYHSLMSFY